MDRGTQADKRWLEAPLDVPLFVYRVPTICVQSGPARRPRLCKMKANSIHMPLFGMTVFGDHKGRPLSLRRHGDMAPRLHVLGSFHLRARKQNLKSPTKPFRAY